jgi:hypothetical protein
MATIETAFEQVITPVTHDLGDFKVNRSLPAREACRWSTASGRAPGC